MMTLMDMQRRGLARKKAPRSVLVHSKNRKEANVTATALARKRLV